jgi:hypothetical protein
MTNTVKPYQSECQTWEQVLPLFKVGTIYNYTPKFAQHIKEDNESSFIFRKETPHLYKPTFVGFFKLTAITGEGKYQSDFEFRSLDGKIVFPNHRFIQVASEVYEEKDLNLMEDLAQVGF